MKFWALFIPAPRAICIAIALLLALAPHRASATHAAGAEIIYEWVSDSTYRIYYKFYRDCAGIDAPGSVDVCYWNQCNTTTGTLTLNKVSGNIPPNIANGSEVIRQCPGSPSKCTSSSGTTPGYREWWYSQTITLPRRCNYWTFAYGEGNRSNYITNLANPGSQYLYVEATLNNQYAQCNTSPNFSTKPVPFVCNNTPTVFNNSAYDANGDSLYYELIQPLTGVCGPPVTPTVCAYAPPAGVNPPYDPAINPLSCNNTMVLDSWNGRMSFTPAGIQRSVVTLKVSEYRNGIKIGSIMRDMQFIVLGCSSNGPTIDNAPVNMTGGAVFSAATNTIIVYPGNTIAFSMRAQCPTSSDSLYLYPYSGFPASASWNVFATGPAKDSGYFSWTPTPQDTGDHVIVFNAVDSTCSSLPFLFSAYTVVNIRVLGFNYSGICLSVATGKAVDTTDIGWFAFGTDTFGYLSPHLNNVSAVQSFTYHYPGIMTLYANTTYTASVWNIERTYFDAPAKITLFIDYNHNHQFDIPQERVWSTISQKGTYVILNNAVNIPASVVKDSLTSMRLIINNDTGANAPSDSACGPYVSGETEDFLVMFKQKPNSTGIVNKIIGISISPNPSSGKFNFKLNTGGAIRSLQVSVTNITGQSIFSKSYTGIERQFSTEMDLSKMPRGLYFMVIDADGERQQRKIIVE